MRGLRKLCRVNWSEESDQTIRQSTGMTDKLLSRINVPSHIMHCNGTDCKDHAHVVGINKVYIYIGSLKQANDVIIPMKSCDKYTPVPGWNQCLDQPHMLVSDAFVEWSSRGKPRQVLFRHLCV